MKIVFSSFRIAGEEGEYIVALDTSGRVWVRGILEDEIEEDYAGKWCLLDSPDDSELKETGTKGHLSALKS